MKNECGHTREMILLLAGELEEDGRRGLLEHLAKCPECRAEFDSLAGTWQGTEEVLRLSRPDGESGSDVKIPARRERRFHVRNALFKIAALFAGCGAILLLLKYQEDKFSPDVRLDVFMRESEVEKTIKQTALKSSLNRTENSGAGQRTVGLNGLHAPSSPASARKERNRKKEIALSRSEVRETRFFHMRPGAEKTDADGLSSGSVILADSGKGAPLRSREDSERTRSSLLKETDRSFMGCEFPLGRAEKLFGGTTKELIQNYFTKHALSIRVKKVASDPAREILTIYCEPHEYRNLLRFKAALP